MRSASGRYYFSAAHASLAMARSPAGSDNTAGCGHCCFRWAFLASASRTGSARPRSEALVAKRLFPHYGDIGLATYFRWRDAAARSMIRIGARHARGCRGAQRFLASTILRDADARGRRARIFIFMTLALSTGLTSTYDDKRAASPLCRHARSLAGGSAFWPSLPLPRLAAISRFHTALPLSAASLSFRRAFSRAGASQQYNFSRRTAWSTARRRLRLSKASRHTLVFWIAT